MFVKKRPEHKTSLRTLVSNTMNVCITSVSFPFFKNNNSAFFEPIVLFLKSSVLFTPCFCAFVNVFFQVQFIFVLTVLR